MVASTSAAMIDPQRHPEVAPEIQTAVPVTCEAFDAQALTLRMSVWLEP